MKVTEALSLFDELKPNSYSQDTKIGWLSDLDKNLINIVFKNRANNPAAEWEPYTAGNAGITELLVPDAHKEVYMTYLAYKVDYYNGEYERFNNSALLYNTHLQDFMSDWNRENQRLNAAKITMN